MNILEEYRNARRVAELALQEQLTDHAPHNRGLMLLAVMGAAGRLATHLADNVGVADALPVLQHGVSSASIGERIRVHGAAGTAVDLLPGTFLHFFDAGAPLIVGHSAYNVRGCAEPMYECGFGEHAGPRTARVLSCILAKGHQGEHLYKPRRSLR